MINFFRKIRKKYADDNRPLKYFRYAIGEIVLVVIGILIALQINNANQDRIEKTALKGYLNSIAKNIESDIETVEIGLKDETNPIDGSETKVLLTLTNEWEFYEIPLSSFTNTNLKKLFMVCEFVFENDARSISVRHIEYLRKK